MLLLFEDADVRRLAVVARGQVHLVSTKGLLVGMKEAGLISSADAVMKAIGDRGDHIARSEAVDLPVEASTGKSSWAPAP